MQLPGLTVRPYQLMCAVCAAGEGDGPGQSDKTRQLLALLRSTPDAPLTLVCNVGDVYVYQDPGTAEDTPEGVDFNRKRDLDILQRLDWAPGVTLPARFAFQCLLKQITATAGICGYDTVTAPGWEGCAKAKSGFYEKGQQAGIKALIPPRPTEEMAAAKEAALAAMRAATVVPLRPHLLLCSICMYGGGTRPPYAADNLPEFLEMVLTEKPDVLVRFVHHADWMMCACCPNRAPGLNACVNILGSGGMSNEKRDLDVLRTLGLHFGDTLKARELYLRIFATFQTTLDSCARPGNNCPSVWWDRSCGDANPETRHKLYEKGREELLARFQQQADKHA